MSVVVRMEMPKGCWDCPCVNGEYGYCQADENERQIEDPNERPSWCPIVCQLPEGHGRLVESDQVAKMIDRWIGYLGEDMIYRIKLALNRDVPTIVPAEAERSET